MTSVPHSQGIGDTGAAALSAGKARRSSIELARGPVCYWLAWLHQSGGRMAGDGYHAACQGRSSCPAGPGAGLAPSLCRRLRRGSDVPVIMLTARRDDFDVVGGLEAGADDYVVKPVEPRVLDARIGAVLRRTAWAGSPAETYGELVTGT